MEKSCLKMMLSLVLKVAQLLLLVKHKHTGPPSCTEVVVECTTLTYHRLHVIPSSLCILPLKEQHSKLASIAYLASILHNYIINNDPSDNVRITLKATTTVTQEYIHFPFILKGK